jgi:hypothetical protein
MKGKRYNLVSFNAISRFAPFKQSSIIGDSSDDEESDQIITLAYEIK